MSYVGMRIRVRHSPEYCSAVPGRVYEVERVVHVQDYRGMRKFYKLKGMPDEIEAKWCEEVTHDAPVDK